MSTIFGLYGGAHDSAAVYIKDGEIISCIEEERINRIKSGNNYFSLPNESLTTIENVSGLNVSEVDHVTFATHTPNEFILNRVKRDVDVYDHHQCHAAGAYYTSGMEGKVLTVIIDGGGTDNSNTVWLCEDGEMKVVHSDLFASGGTIAQVWGYVLHGIHELDKNGNFVWKMCKDEGKLMGMAPDGEYDEMVYNALKDVISYDSLRFFPANTIGKATFLSEALRRSGYFSTKQGISNFAHNLQLVTEEIIIEYLHDLHALYPEYDKIAVAGGLFANVKLNQKINQLDWVKEIFVFPAMSDSGLALGAAILKSKELGEGFEKPIKLNNVHFGLSYSDEEVYKASLNFEVERTEYVPSEMAKEINDGKIIGWFQDGFEYGPRALGSRSILVRPTNPETHRILNERLKRYDTMPFAPMVMEEYFNEIFVEDKSKYTAEFMTMCYDTKEEWIEKIPAVIQKSDKTARPQIVRKEAIPKYWEIVDEYRKLSGIPVLLNTSFNAHNEPIINTPQNALKHLVFGVIDKLIIGNYVYAKK